MLQALRLHWVWGVLALAPPPTSSSYLLDFLESKTNLEGLWKLAGTPRLSQVQTTAPGVI